MNIKTDLYAELSVKADLIALISTRLYPSFNANISAENDDYPYVTFDIVNQQPIMTMGGTTNLIEASVQFDIWALDSLDVTNVYEVLRKYLDGKYFGNVEISKLDNALTVGIVTPTDGSTQAIYRGLFEIGLYYRENVIA